MNKNNLFRFTLMFFSMLIPAFSASAQTSVSVLKPTHAKVLNAWLAVNKGWRLALEKDYGTEQLDYFRKQAGVKLLPFYVTKDFNRDRREDFAVILTDGKKYAAAIFNVPFVGAKPAFFTDEIEAGDIVYYNPYTNRLLIGPYASDAGFQMIPNGKTYKIKFFLMVEGKRRF
ncbi:MAG: hypothetical protein ACR2L1_05710 [Pyrinomonadaceae bacterium]